MFIKSVYGVVVCMLWTYPKITPADNLFSRIHASTSKGGSLDATIPPTPSLISPILTTTGRRIERRANPNESSELNWSAEERGSNEYDYDKAYERFVEKYFNEKRTDALGEDDKQSESVEASDDTAVDKEWDDLDPYVAASTHHYGEICRKEHRNGRECTVCRNSRNNQKSESCSYSTETEPHSYNYSKTKTFKSQKDSSSESGEEEPAQPEEEQEVNEDGSNKAIEEKYKNNAKVSETKVTNKSKKKREDSSSCLRKVEKNRICYYCNKTDGKQFTKCYPHIDRDTKIINKPKKNVKRWGKKPLKRMANYSSTA